MTVFTSFAFHFFALLRESISRKGAKNEKTKGADRFALTVHSKE
jgi:hypothetical protein